MCVTLSSAHKLLRIVDFGTSDGRQFNLNKIETTIDYYIAFIDIQHRQSGIAKYTFGLLTSCPRVVTTLNDKLGHSYYNRTYSYNDSC